MVITEKIKKRTYRQEDDDFAKKENTLPKIKAKPKLQIVHIRIYLI